MILLDNFASAAFIAPECMSKRPLVGVSQGTTFSDEQILMNSVEPDMSLYGYLECNDENGDIDKFEFVVADANAQNRISLTAVGSTPSESLNCKGFTIDSDKIDKAVIWADAEQVYGIRLVSTYDNKAIDIGSFGKGDPPTLEEFTGRDQLIGFYGSYTEDKVTSLGFLTHDPRCVAEEDPEPNPDVTPGTSGTETENGDADGEGEGGGTVIPGTDPGDPEATDDSEESSSSLGVILGAALGAAVLIGAGVGGFLLWRKRKRNREDNAVDAVKVSQTAEMKSHMSKHHNNQIIEQDMNDDEQGSKDEHIPVAPMGANSSQRELVQQETEDK